MLCYMYALSSFDRGHQYVLLCLREDVVGKILRLVWSNSCVVNFTKCFTGGNLFWVVFVIYNKKVLRTGCA